jgi:N-methylhydantoinase A
VTLERSISMRYQRQVHELLTPVETAGALDRSDLDTVIDRFEKRYEQRYGEGSAFAGGDIEMLEFRVRAIGPLDTPTLHEHPTAAVDPSGARIATKEMQFEAADGPTDAGVYEFESMSPGMAVDGPAVIVTPVTTIVVNPGDVAEMDRYRNVRIDVDT